MISRCGRCRRRRAEQVLLTGAVWALAALAHADGAPVAQPARVERLADYEPRELAGFDVRVHRALLADEALTWLVLEALRQDLEVVRRVVPAAALDVLSDTVVWVERQGAEVPGGMSGRGMVYHPSRAWLERHGLLGEKAKGVEIVRAADYLDWRDHQPAMVLHEFAHALHDAIGFHRPDVERAFERACASGRYERVAYVLSPSGPGRRAYAMQNAREYFAELSEAYFGFNDFEPFTRDALREFDPEGYALIERLWRDPRPYDGAAGEAGP